ncbi:MAG: hypothetical protein ACJ761_02485 [Chloroflexota bacterium]
MSQRREGPRIVCYPTSDPDFTIDVRAAIARSTLRIREGERLIAEVRERLRAHYPNVVIHRKEPLAKLGPEDETWYVYRDGRIA